MLSIRIIGLVVYEIMVFWIGIWLNVTRYQEGPNVLQLAPGHSLHVMDLAIVGAGLLPLILLGLKSHLKIEA